MAKYRVHKVQRAYLYSRISDEFNNADKDYERKMIEDTKCEKRMDFSDIKFNNPIENSSNIEECISMNRGASVYETTKCSSSVSMTFSGIVCLLTENAFSKWYLLLDAISSLLILYTFFVLFFVAIDAAATIRRHEVIASWFLMKS